MEKKGTAVAVRGTQGVDFVKVSRRLIRKRKVKEIRLPVEGRKGK